MENYKYFNVIVFDGKLKVVANKEAEPLSESYIDTFCWRLRCLHFDFAEKQEDIFRSFLMKTKEWVSQSVNINLELGYVTNNIEIRDGMAYFKPCEIQHINATAEFLSNPESIRIIDEMVAIAYNKKIEPSNKTALQQLQDWINTPVVNYGGHKSIVQKVNELLEVERQIIVDAHNDGIEDPESYGGATYYNEKFKNNK